MDGTSSLALLLRLGLSLAVVLALMAGAAAVLRRRGSLLGRRPGAALEVIARQPLGKTASVAVVRAGDRGLIVGVTEHSVRVLGEAELDQFAPKPGTGNDIGTPGTALPAGVERPQSAWTVLLDRMRERTVRRI